MAGRSDCAHGINQCTPSLHSSSEPDRDRFDMAETSATTRSSTVRSEADARRGYMRRISAQRLVWKQLQQPPWKNLPGVYTRLARPGKSHWQVQRRCGGWEGQVETGDGYNCYHETRDRIAHLRSRSQCQERKDLSTHHFVRSTVFRCFLVKRVCVRFEASETRLPTLGRRL